MFPLLDCGAMFYLNCQTKHLAVHDVGFQTVVAVAAGLYDPWSPYGVLQDISDTVVAVIIPEVRPACSPAIRHLAWVDYSPLAFRAAS